jgi:hypothetical protein
LFATIPHYRLRKLHEALLQFPDYKFAAIEVEGVRHAPPDTGRLSLLQVLGAEAGLATDGTFIDSEVLDDYDVTEREAIAAEEKASAA